MGADTRSDVVAVKEGLRAGDSALLCADVTLIQSAIAFSFKYSLEVSSESLFCRLGNVDYVKRLIKQLILSRASATQITQLQNLGIVGSGGGVVDVGEGTYGENHLIIHKWNSKTKIKIGKYCSIADSVHIFLGGNHDISAVSTYPFGTTSEELIGPREGHPKSNGDISIGNDVWIGSHVSIMSGIVIGDGAVIAAFSHVVKDVLPYEVVGGNPARHIKMRFDAESVEKLLKVRWWDWEKSEIRHNRDLLTSNPGKFFSEYRTLS